MPVLLSPRIRMTSDPSFRREWEGGPRACHSICPCGTGVKKKVLFLQFHNGQFSHHLGEIIDDLD
jgi:hypothetical protein